MNLPAFVEIPVYGAGVFSLLQWYVPELAAGATEYTATTPLLLVILVAGTFLLRNVIPQLLEA